MVPRAIEAESSAKSEFANSIGTNDKEAIHRLSGVPSILDCKLSTLLLVFVYSFLLIENPLEAVIPGIGYHDELLFFVLSALAFLKNKANGKAISVHARWIALSTLLIVVIGAIGNVCFDYQRSFEAMYKDVIAFSKFPITLIAVMSLLRDVDCRSVVSMCSAISKVFIVVCFVVGVVNTLQPSDAFSHDFRNGIWSFKFVYSHPTFLVFSLVMAYVMVSAQSKRLDFVKVMCLITLILTMRDKAFGFVGLVLVVLAMNLGNRKRLVPALLLAGAVVVAVVWPKIAEYMSYSNSPRESLYSASFVLAQEGFPIGAGFVSIACTLSGEYYSDVYYRFGMNTMSGLTPLSSAAAGDAGFAYYLGEFGFLGFALFAFLMYQVLRWILDSTPIGSCSRTAAIYLFGYAVIALTVETALTNATGVSLAVLMALALTLGRQQMSTNGEYKSEHIG